MLKIGIMGGTFNPIHLAHVRMADEAYHQAELDKVLFMPSKRPPHKDNSEIISEYHRSNMIKLAIKDYDYFEYSDFELKRDSVTYSAETLTMLTDKNPDVQYYFILGADSFFHIEQWYKPEVIMQKSVLLPVGRNSTDIQMQRQETKLREKYNADIMQVVMEPLDVSSSYIRKCIEAGKVPSGMLDNRVWEYIQRNNCY